MRPLHEIPAPAIHGLRGIFADIDDTLTWRGKLVPAAVQAIFDARAAGLRVMLATGRPGGWGEVLGHLLPVDAVVTENGGYALLADGTRRFWDDDATRAEQRRRLDALVAEAARELPFAGLALDAPLRRVDVAFDVNEHRHLSREQIDQLAALAHSHGAKTVVSSIHLHAFYGDHDKAKMLVRLAGELWQESPVAVRAHYLFAGDSPNDQAAFAYFPLAAGVANVRKYEAVLNPPPAFVANREGGEGFAEIVWHVLAGR